ncbi:MAG: DNA-binding protein [Hydrogenophilaceae bacterium]|nr:DNA-binding protein [Hydrogenophilaceae bacterium]
MKTLFLAWQTPGASRAWFPVGRLDADVPHSHYSFRYIKGALKAKEDAGFEPLLAFPDFKKCYEADELFPLFRNRVLDPQRKDFEEYLQLLHMEREQADPIEILALTGGERQTDSLEVFPKLDREPDNTFACTFFLHGLRHVSESGQKRAELLRQGESLRVAVELNNPATKLAIQLATEDYQIVGWTPRYLVNDILELVKTYQDIRAHVVRVNEIDAPMARRVMIQLAGKLPEKYEPMSGEIFQPIGCIA